MNSTYFNLLIYFLIGLSSISVIDTAGAIASRKFKFKYSYLSILSCTVYVGIGYLVSEEYGLLTAIIINFILAFYDSTIGLKFSQIFKANIEEKMEPQSNLKMIIIMSFTGIFFALIGYFISVI